MIIDFHTHAFPDNVAARAIPALAKEGKVTAHTQGTVDSLLASMDRAGITSSVVCSIATRPSQFEPIVAWSSAIQSPRLIPLPSIHPADADAVGHVFRLKNEGFRGIKMHPYYQDFSLDEERLTPLYEALCETGLLLVVHCGYDIAFPRIRRADPNQILTVKTRFPDLRLITTHFGGWDIWKEVEEVLIGKEIFMEISFALTYLSPEQSVRMLNSHPSDYLLFGTDSPWDDQLLAIQRLESLNLNKELLHRILGQNAKRLLL
ncbi:MAG: amidohydrolase family protein [Proteobacteria bacterium]|nr:amidohydrolase family protein [Pseudomonadota bacterium]MBU1648181.1 amidohydrolase family protein [Pseudomonadota bacterium]MBU1985688.1 amidohydrolase family protein [Pseudomonadota bacterium]